MGRPAQFIMMTAAVLSAALLLLPTLSFAFISPSAPPHHRQLHNTCSYKKSLHLYKKFHDYAWEKLHYDDESSGIHNVPDHLKTNTSPVKGSDNNVVVACRSMSEFETSNNNKLDALRLARSAFLETQTNSSEAVKSPMAIHVLNFVMFPTTHLRDTSSDAYVGLPIFGADIVSLPGNKHLVALDFQPVLALNNEDESLSANLFPSKYSHLEARLSAIHAKYQKSSEETKDPLLAWGGDIPPQAMRWFSPYSLWTRLVDENAIQTVSTTVWDAYREYVDLYFELMHAVQKDLDDGNLKITSTEETNSVITGQREYLEYRRINDPARPMLQRLYGKDWTEELIDGVLFPTL